MKNVSGAQEKGVGGTGEGCGEPLRSQGCEPAHHSNAWRESWFRVTLPVKPPSRTAVPNCCCTYSKYRRAPVRPRVMAVTLPTNRARSRVAKGESPRLRSRRAVRCASQRRARGTEQVIAAVSQANPKHVNCLEGRKEHLDVLRFRPTCVCRRLMATAIPRARVVRSRCKINRSSM